MRLLCCVDVIVPILVWRFWIAVATGAFLIALVLSVVSNEPARLTGPVSPVAPVSPVSPLGPVSPLSPFGPVSPLGPVISE